MSCYQKYPKYKDSGVDWIGKIPVNWEAKRLRYVLKLVTKKSDDDDQLALALQNIESWTGRYISSGSEFEGAGVSFQHGDILFGKLRPYLAKAYLAEFNGAAVGDFHVLRPCRPLNGRFMLYLLLNQGFISTVDGSTFGAKMPRVNWDFMRNIIIPIPPINEQQTIANFLDRKTTQIDELIAKKEDLLKKLDEKRSALISHAVTRGLPTEIAHEFGLKLHSKYKDSGIEWLREVPEEWEVIKVRHLTRFKCGSTPATNDDKFWSDGMIPWVTPKDMKSGRIINTQDHLTPYGASQCASGLITPGHVLIVVRSGILRHSLPVAINDETVTLNQDMRAFILSDQLNPEYLKWFIDGNQKTLLEQWCKSGTTVESIEMEYLSASSLPVPSIIEQTAISAYLDCETDKIDQLIQKIKKAVEQLKEYRLSIIANAVTGSLQIT